MRDELVTQEIRNKHCWHHFWSQYKYVVTSHILSVLSLLSTDYNLYICIFLFALCSEVLNIICISNTIKRHKSAIITFILVFKVFNVFCAIFYIVYNKFYSSHIAQLIQQIYNAINVSSSTETCPLSFTIMPIIFHIIFDCIVLHKNDKLRSIVTNICFVALFIFLFYAAKIKQMHTLTSIFWSLLFCYIGFSTTMSLLSLCRSTTHTLRQNKNPYDKLTLSSIYSLMFVLIVYLGNIIVLLLTIILIKLIKTFAQKQISERN